MGWNSLTERQKTLDRAIEQCEITLENTALCLRRVITAIGATPSEEQFVRSRIELRIHTVGLLNETDSFFANTDKMFEQFEKDD